MSTVFEVTNDQHDPNYSPLGPTNRQESLKQYHISGKQ